MKVDVLLGLQWGDEEQQRSRTQREKLEPSRPSVRDKLKQELPANKSAAPKKRELER